MRHVSPVLGLLVLGASVALWGSARAAPPPHEAERDNREYLLDIVTNDYSRSWREIWDAEDNRFRFRLGSNNVTQWFVDEEIKLSAALLDRVRFRFYHSRQFRYSTEQISWDVMEFEGRVHKRMYLSLYARPTVDKRKSSLGVIVQHRRAVNRFFMLSVEWPGFLRNSSEHWRDTPDSLLDVFTDQPVRFGIDVREKITRNVWIRAVGEIVPSFEMGDEETATGLRIPRESAEAKALDGWVEYVVDPSRDVRDQMAFGIEAGYQRSKKSKAREAEALPTGNPDVEALASENPSVRAFSHTDGPPWAVPQNHFGEDLYEQTDDDTITAWRDTRRFVSPYAWVPLGERVTLRATLRYEEREIAIDNDAQQTFHTTNEYVIPRLGVLYSMGSQRQYIIETGLVSEFRERTEERFDGPSGRATMRKDDYEDHRLYLAFEYVFGGSNVIRLNEGFELDSEDRGKFGIHDHGFFQLIIGF
jgi:hypothetical protein